MGAEFTRHKTQLKVEIAFQKSLGLGSWSVCKETYPEHCTDTFLRAFVPLFKEFKDSSGKKKGEEATQLVSYPDRFNAHILQARAWLTMQTVADANTMRTNAFDCLVFEHPKLGDLFYQLHTGDARKTHEFVTTRDFTLCLLDIPYGFSLPDCLHDDQFPWGVNDIRQAVQSFKVVSTARVFRFIIFHSLDQRDAVKSILVEECNGGIENCMWYKPNVKNSGGARLWSHFESFTIGFHNRDGRRTMDHFNFGPKDNRGNVVVAPSLTSKLKHTGDNKPVNVYQKPRKVLNWMVNHFSETGDWVLDLCSGSGTGLVSALGLGRNCVAVEIDPRQADVLPSRVLSLADDLLGESEISRSDEGEDEEEAVEDSRPADLAGPSGSVAGASGSPVVPPPGLDSEAV